MENKKVFISQADKSPAEAAYVNLIYTTGHFSTGFAHLLKPFGLSEQQYNVLRILRDAHPGPCTLSAVSSRMIDKMSNATRLVDKLLLKGLVTRELCPDNRRKVDICITEQGLELLYRIEPEINKFINNMMGSAEKAKELNEILDQVRNVSDVNVMS
ncbi:MAG: MarR family transcriptional regulator [Flavobacteriales bacterium]|nr:MarR family transcriptional regulator [Flavobacteriales bacterium]